MFGSLGGPELILILVVALIVFGPRKLPEIGKSMGKMLMEFRRASNDFKRTIEDEVEAEKAREAHASLPPLGAAPPASIATPDTAAGAPPAPTESAEPAAAPAPPGAVARDTSAGQPG